MIRGGEDKSCKQRTKCHLEILGDLERDEEDTASTILYMTLQAGGIRSIAAEHAASYIRKASGLLLLLKFLPSRASCHGRIPYIPAGIASTHELLIARNGRSEIRAESGEGLSNAVFEVTSIANVHLQKVLELAKTVPAEAVPVLPSAVPARVLLDSL